MQLPDKMENNGPLHNLFTYASTTQSPSRTPARRMRRVLVSFCAYTASGGPEGLDDEDFTRAFESETADLDRLTPAERGYLGVAPAEPVMSDFPDLAEVVIDVDDDVDEEKKVADASEGSPTVDPPSNDTRATPCALEKCTLRPSRPRTHSGNTSLFPRSTTASPLSFGPSGWE